MPIIKKKHFDPAPEGEHNAVCVDVTPSFWQDGKFGRKRKFKIVWEIESKMKDGRPFLISKAYTESLNEKSNLRKDLKAWRTRDFTPEELKGFDVDKVLGAPCRLIIIHNEGGDGETYANIETVLRAGPRTINPSGKYVRVKDRPDYKPEDETAQSDAPEPYPDAPPPTQGEPPPEMNQPDADCPF